MAEQVVILRLRDISKSFLATKAVDRVSLELRAGEVHAVVGENGAGKSTLIKIIGGVHQPDRGEIHMRGAPITFRSPREARAAGIEVIPQEMQLVPSATVAENIALGDLPTRRLLGVISIIDRHAMRARASAVLKRLDFRGSLDARVDGLSHAERQIVAIAKALDHNARLLILDEPTASLDQREVEHLFDILNHLRAKGIGIVYVSHRLGEIVRLADRCTVLRDGRVVDSSVRGDIDEDRLVRLMTGRDLDERLRPPTLSFGDRLLKVGAGSDGTGVDALVVSSGEIVGLGGLLGSGAGRMLRRIFGAVGPPIRFELGGRSVRIARPAAAIGAGLGFVPGERRQGLVMTMSVRDNICLPLLGRATWRLGRRRKRIDEMIAQVISTLDIRPPDPGKAVRELSGGNQQKVLFARWLVAKASLLLLDEPTRGIDVGAKQRVHRLMHELAAEGKGVLFTSSELEEIVAISDTVLAVRRGRIVNRIARQAGAYNEGALRRALGRAE